MPYEGLRIPFYFEFIQRTGEEMKQKFDQVGLKDWPLDGYQPLPFWKTTQVFEDEKRGFDLYAISFKEALHTFADTVNMPWLTEVSSKDPVNGGILINAATARERGIENGDRIRLISPAGSIEGYAAVVEGIHPQVIGVGNAISRRFVRNATFKSPGSHFNRLLTGSMQYTDSATGGLESTARVQLEKVQEAVCQS
jgi:anaerobic selenocysteine-containing dehydrogenase